MRKRTLAREFALQLFYQREMNPEPVKELLDNFWTQHEQAGPEVRDFSQMLVQGALDHLEEIDAVIQKAADNWQLDRMAIVDRNTMRLAAFELLFVKDIPPKVTINEAVNLAKKFSQEDSGKFVNGVLDKINHSEKPRY